MMSQIGQPLDEIGIVLVARMYHIHVAIIQEDFFWTTRHDHDIAQCKVLFGWQGSLQFIDIKRKVDQLVPFYNLRNAKYGEANVPLPLPSPQHPFGPQPRPYNLRLGANPVKKEPIPEPGPEPPQLKLYNLRSAGVFPPE